MSSTSSSSSSSAAANSVVVTARDIEFSNYDSSTGKWGNAVMTMMILDTDTPNNINLEVYDEKAYAVFRNHDDPTDTVRTSAEVDGMDFRVTISTPMVASGKYELYKVYGETSGHEYATTSQFYFQVPGKVWDFDNDTVEEDVELVSDWFNYGHVVTSDGVVHGFPTLDDAWNAATAATETADVVVNGETINNSEIAGYKLTSLAAGASTKSHFLTFATALEDFDIVSSKITTTGTQYDGYGPSEWRVFNKRFAFPETLTYLKGFFKDIYNFDQPVYIPDSVTKLTSFFGFGGSDKAGYTSKIRMSPNITELGGYNFRIMKKWAGSFENMSINVQLRTISAHPFVCGYGTDWGKGLTNGTWTAPSAWTYIPSYWMYGGYGRPYESGMSTFTPYSVVIPEGVTSISSNSFVGLPITSIKLPSTLETLGSPVFEHISGVTVNEFLKLDMGECTNVTTLPDSFLYGSAVDISGLRLPPNLVTIGNHFFTIEGRPHFTNCPTDEDGKKYFEIPEGVTTLGGDCLGGAIMEVDKLILPSTLTSVGRSFCYIMFNGGRDFMKELDLSQFSPEVFAESNQSFACYSGNGYYEAYWKITVAPGTADEWAERFPNMSYEYRGATYWARHIEWIEKPTKYGYVFYETNYADTNPAKGYVELQSMDDFNKFVNGPNAVTDAAITVDTDDQGNTIELHFGISSQSSQGADVNTITGFHIGTDITTVPDNFLRSYRYLTYLRWGGNETSIGSYVGYNAGRYARTSDQPGNYDLSNIPDTVTTIGEFFFRNSIMNEDVHIPDSVTTISYFLHQCTSFNQPITIPDSVTTISNFLSGCTSFNQPITIPDSVTTISNFLHKCTSFNQPITIPDSVTTISNFLSYCTSFNQPVSINNGVYNNGFLEGCIAFNSTVTVNNVGPHSGKAVTRFLRGCSAFNKPLDLSPFLGADSFDVLAECPSFNSQLILPTSIRIGNILDNGSAFNQPITLPEYTEITGIYSRVCYGWTSFNQPITIPESWCKTRWNNNASLFENCDSLTSTVTFNSTTVPNGVDTNVIQKSFTTTDAAAAAYTTGVTFAGTGAQAWKDVLPDYDGTQTTPANTYRKINVV